MTCRKALSLAAATAVLIGCTAVYAAGQSQPQDPAPFSGDAFGAAQAGEAREPGFAYESEEAMLAAMKLAASNARYELYYSAETMAVALKDRATGAVMTSNPYNASNDPLSAGDITKNLESQIVLTYIDEDNNQASLWSSADCLAYGQYSVQEGGNGVRFNMTLGRDSNNRLFPMAMTQERFDAVTSQLEGRTLRRLKALYTLVDAAALDEETRKTLVEQYPLLAEQPLYVAVDDLTDRDRDDLEEAFAAAGYTAEDLAADNEALGIQTEEAVFPSFQIAVEYTLTDEGLNVRLPRDSIAYDDEHYTLFSIRVLEFFGADQSIVSAGSAEQPDPGYIFLPDGSGALIDIDATVSNRRPIISGTVYGRDAAVTQTVDERANEQYYLPVYGIRRNNGTALFAVIDGGAEVSTISAKLGAPNSSYFTVYNTFSMTTSEEVSIAPKVESLGSRQQIFVYDENAYHKDMSVTFHLLTGEDADYMGMAQCYRSWLLAHGMEENEAANRLTLGIETLGTSLYPATFMGVEYDGDAAYTTYLQSREIAQYFKDNGVSDVVLTLNGWRDKGLDAGVANRVKLSGALGGKKDFLSLASWASENGVALYPESDMLFVSHDRAFDGFWKSSDGGRMLNKKYAGDRTYRPDSSQVRNLAYAISPHKYASYWEKYFKGLDKLNLTGAGLGSVGQFLNSNFNKDHAFNRGQTLDIVRGELEELSQRYSLSFNGANAYVLPYASILKDLPLHNSGLPGESASVPFVQLVVSGAAVCQSQPINLEEDVQAALLGCIESRTSPSFVLAADNIERLKTTSYTQYYAVDFEVLKEKALSYYRYVAEALESVEGQAITDHQMVADGVACTSYADGTRIYVNYNDTAYTADGVSVEANGYAVVS